MSVHRGTVDARNRVWNDGTLAWDAMTQPSTGPGSGSTSVSARTLTSSGGSVEGSTSGPLSTVLGLHTRSVLPALLSVASSNAFASTSFSVGSSGATARNKVFAYSVMSTSTTATEIGFYDGATLKWPLVLQAQAGGITGANLAVSPPGWLFAGSTGAPLTLQVPSSLAGYRVAIGYFQEP